MLTKHKLLAGLVVSACYCYAQQGIGGNTGGTSITGAPGTWPSYLGASGLSSPSIGTTPITESFIAGTGGTIANTLVKTDASFNAVTTLTSDTGAYGIAMSTVSATAGVQVARLGVALCFADNATTIGHLVIVGTGTAGYCRDSAQTSSSAVSNATRIIGVFKTAVSGGALASVELMPSHFGTQTGWTDNGTTVSALSGRNVGIGTRVPGSGAGVYNNPSTGLDTNSINGVAPGELSGAFNLAMSPYSVPTGSDDTSAINSCLSTHSSCYLPEGVTASVIATGGGIMLPSGKRLFGLSTQTSHISVSGNWSAPFNFVANGKFTNIVVTGNSGSGGTGTIHFSWIDGLDVGNSVTIAGSATAGLNGTFTVATLVDPATVTFSTPSSVPNGTYTNPTGVTATVGIAGAVIRCATRETFSSVCYYNEIDHLNISSATTGAFTLIDETNMNYHHVHDLQLGGTGTGDHQVAITCADRSPSNTLASCFHGRNTLINAGNVGVVLNTVALDGNVSNNTFQNITGAARIAMSTYGNLQVPAGYYGNWYIAADSNALSYDIAGTVPGNSLYFHIDVEGAVNLPGATTYHVNTLAWVPATAGYTVGFPGIASTGPITQSGTAVALQGVDVNSSNQVTATHLSAALPYAQGGTASTITFTQSYVPFTGSTGFTQDSNFNWDATNHRLNLGATGGTNPLNVTVDASGRGFQVIGTAATLAMVQGGVKTTLLANSSTVPFVFGTGSGASIPSGAEVDLQTNGFTVAKLLSDSGGGHSFQIPATSTDPACAASADIGKFWFQTVDASNTVFRVCINTASSTPAWVTK